VLLVARLQRQLLIRTLAEAGYTVRRLR